MSEYSENLNFIDLKQQQLLIRNEIENSIKEVLDHGNYIMGPEVGVFEKRLSEFTGCKHSITCANGTDALSIALMSLNIGAGHVVFVPSFTYVATAEAPAQLGSTPFFVDVDEQTFNLCPKSLKQAIVDAKKQNLKAKAVIAVDLFGLPSDAKELEDLCREEGMKLIIDAAQSFGGELNNKMVGNYGDITTTSFFPAKPLGCYGDGGCIFTNDSDLSEIITSLRLHGKGNQKYDNVRIGVNSRLDTLQAAILLRKLDIFPNELQLRRNIASIYNSFLDGQLKTPKVFENSKSAWAQYTIRAQNRDVLKEKLNKKGIPSVIYYPKSLHQQDGYKHFPSVSTGLSNSEILPNEVLSLPMHPYLSQEEISFICYSVLNEKK